MDDTETLGEKSMEEALKAWNTWQPETDFERQLKERFDFNKAMVLLVIIILFVLIRTIVAPTVKITKNDPLRKHKKQIAEMTRAKRELEVMANYHDVPQNFNGDEDFLEYFNNNTNNPASKSVFNNFNEFVKAKTIKGKFPFKLVSEKLIEEYKSYLENHYKNSTAWMYLIKLKTILNKAVKDKLISKSPAKFIKNKYREQIISKSENK